MSLADWIRSLLYSNCHVIIEIFNIHNASGTVQYNLHFNSANLVICETTVRLLIYNVGQIISRSHEECLIVILVFLFRYW